LVAAVRKFAPRKKLLMLSLHIFLEFEDMFQLSKISGSSFGYDIFVEIFKTDVKIQGFFFLFFFLPSTWAAP